MESPSSPRETISRFGELLAGLVRAEVDFAVVGGVAVILNGHHRQTKDAEPGTIRRLLAYLTRWGEGWARELRPEELTLQEGSIWLLEGFELDFFTQMRGRRLDDFRPQLRYLRSDEVKIPYLHPRHLIELKTGSWRAKDQLDVRAMQEVLAREAAGEVSPTI